MPWLAALGTGEPSRGRPARVRDTRNATGTAFGVESAPGYVCSPATIRALSSASADGVLTLSDPSARGARLRRRASLTEAKHGYWRTDSTAGCLAPDAPG